MNSSIFNLIPTNGTRHARRRLQELAHDSREPFEPAWSELRHILTRERDVPRRLRVLWALFLTGGCTGDLLADLLGDPEEYIRAWSVRLLGDPAGRPRAVTSMTSGKPVGLERFVDDPSPLVRLWMAAALQRINPDDRWHKLPPLLAHAEDAEDHNLPLMLWYAIEPLVMQDPPRAIRLALQAKIPLVSQFIFRRLASDPKAIEIVLQALSRANDDRLALMILEQITAAMAGRAEVTMPRGWRAVLPRLFESRDPAVARAAESLSVIFGDREILPRMRELLLNSRAAIADRQRAMELLVRARDAELVNILPTMMNKLPELREPALRAMATFNDPHTPGMILSRYRDLTAPERQTAVTTLASRPSFAAALLEAMAKGVVPRRDVSAYNVRQILAFHDTDLQQGIEKHWGAIHQTSADKARAIADYKRMLTPRYLESANLSNGRMVFTRTCMPCHALFGIGGHVGPDLTGSNRANLDYILENVIDPSAIVGKEYQFHIFEMDDGQVVTGIVRGETDTGVTVQTQTEQVVLPKSQIRERRPSDLSMMPEELLAGLTNEEVRDLVAYLASPQQAPMPGEK